MEKELSNASSIMLLKRLSGLTWDQVASLFGVERRIVHYWAGGKEMNADNELHLYMCLHIVQQAYQNSASLMRINLIRPIYNHQNAIELLQNKKYALVLKLLKPPQQPEPKLRLSKEAMEARRGPRPWELIADTPDCIHETVGIARPLTKLGKAKQKEDKDLPYSK